MAKVNKTPKEPKTIQIELTGLQLLWKQRLFASLIQQTHPDYKAESNDPCPPTRLSSKHILFVHILTKGYPEKMLECQPRIWSGDHGDNEQHEVFLYHTEITNIGFTLLGESDITWVPLQDIVTITQILSDEHLIN